MRTQIGRWLTRRLNPNPIFVVGISRSGTSILLQAIGAHPQVLAARGEAPLIRLLATLADRVQFSEEREYIGENLFMPKEELYEALQRLCFETVFGSNYGWTRIIKDIQHRDLSILRKTHWCAKIGAARKEYQGLRCLFAGARFVYIVRNGIDVVHSRTRFRGFRHLDFETHCRKWAESVKDFGHLQKAPDAIQVRHEQMVANPERFLDQVFAFAGLAPHAQPLGLLRSTLLIPLDEPTQTQVDVRQVFERRQRPYEAWTREQRETFRQVAGAAMQELGYKIPF